MNKLLCLLMGIAWMLSSFCYANKYEDWKDSSVYIRVMGNNYISWSGSGYIKDKEQGHILTAGHVIYDANSIEIFYDDGTKTKAKFWKRYPDCDLGFIVVDPNTCIAESPHLALIDLGSEVCVIGTPFGKTYQNSLSFGHITGKRTFIGFDCEFLQTDAAINPGNSGGPVFDMDGNVIGISSMIVNYSGQWCGLGFLVPSDYIMIAYIDFDKDY